jgi:PAS domain S-box-containing protein
MKLTGRFVVLIVALLLAVGATGVTGVVSLAKMAKAVASLVDEDMARLLIITTARRQFRSILVIEAEHILEQDSARMAVLESSLVRTRGELDLSLHTYEKFMLPGEASTLADLRGVFERGGALDEHILAMSKQGRDVEAFQFYQTHKLDGASWESTTGLLVSANERRLHERAERTLSVAHRARAVLVVVSGLAAAGAALLGTIVWIGIRRSALAVASANRNLEQLNQTLETRVEERTAELSTSRERYRAVLESTQAIPWEMAPGSLRFAYVGPQVGRLLGSSADDWTGADFFASHLHPDDAEEARAGLEAINGAGAQGELEFRMVSKDGRVAWLRAFVQSEVDRQGRPVRRGIFVEVTKQRMLEADLRSAQKLECVGRLATGVAHEINTPTQYVSNNLHFVQEAFAQLTPFVRAARVVVRECPTTPAATSRSVLLAREADAAADTDYALEHVPDALGSAIEGLHRIATIVKSLKEFAHPDGKGSRAMDLNANLRSTLTVAGHEYKDVAVLETELGELPPVVCVAGEINQVLLNLIVNAAHAVSDVVAKTKTAGLIKVRSWQDGSHVCVQVSDSGPGIAAENRDKVFEPFFSTKEVGRGSGQGLAIARAIVDQHGGTLTFETELGRGTSFLLRLPIDPVGRRRREALSETVTPSTRSDGGLRYANAS